MKPEFNRKLVVVLKGYPRLSETFIAQELLGLEQAGLELVLVSLRQPTDTSRHAVHDEIKARVMYLPEYLHEEPLRVLRALVSSATKPGFLSACKAFVSHLRKDFTRNRCRRFGQAMVLVSEWPDNAHWLYAHFIHTPGSVADYTSRILYVPWSVSAHAKDIWTSPDWELQGKLKSAAWTVTCTRVGHAHLQSLADDPSRVHLSYHGIDLNRFPQFEASRQLRDGGQADDPVIILSVGRAVPKKGFDILLQALALLPGQYHWRFIHIGGGTELEALKKQALDLDIEDRISWEGAVNQSAVLSQYRSADIFALACRITADGDRDGLPNVLVESASQGLACVSTDISAIPELFVDDKNGLLVSPEDAQALSDALVKLISDPNMRARLAGSAQATVRSAFDYHASINQLTSLFEAQVSGQG